MAAISSSPREPNIRSHLRGSALRYRPNPEPSTLCPRRRGSGLAVQRPLAERQIDGIVSIPRVPTRVRTLKGSQRETDNGVSAREDVLGTDSSAESYTIADSDFSPRLEESSAVRNELHIGEWNPPKETTGDVVFGRWID